MTHSASWLLLAPRNLCVLILLAYRAVVSPLYGDVCRFYPSCSHYALQAIQQHGIARGLYFGIRRLLRCHPWAEGGIDDIPPRASSRMLISRLGFVTGWARLPASPSARSRSFITSQGKG